MAGSPSSENTSLLDAAGSSRSPRTLSPQPAPLDWEVLSLSTMSASTLGLPSQKPDESETLADMQYKDKNFTEKAECDAPVEPFSEVWRPHLSPSASGLEAYTKDSYALKKDDEREEMQPLAELPHEDLVSADGNPNRSISSDRDEGIPVISSKKKTIKVSWWKCQVVTWQPQSRKYGAVLSIALVAAVVGIAVIGHRWHWERNINQQLRLELSAKEEKLNDMMYQVNRMKEAMTGRRRVGITRGSFF